MLRRIYEEKMNFPKNFTNFIRLFIFFYFRLFVEIFVRAINKYAEKEIELERRKISEFSIYNRYFNWKFLTIREKLIFLGILIFMDSDRKSKIKNY
jgi:hypothetical protein